MTQIACETVGIVFENAGVACISGAEGVLLRLQQLLPGAVAEADLAFGAEERVLIAIVRLRGGRGAAEARQRLDFWVARSGGRTENLGGDGEDLWRRRAERCAGFRAGVTAAGVGDALDELLRQQGATRIDRGAAGPLALLLDLAGPGALGIVYDAEGRRLFLPGALAPPVGDEFGLAVRVAGAARPLRARARVASVRPPQAAGPGAPAGFLLELGGVGAPLASALRASCQPLAADCMPAEARRAAPRYEVRAPVVLERLGEADGEESPVASIPGELVNISLGGAFVRAESTAAAGARLRLRVDLGGDPALAVEARMVYASATGMGLKFEPDAAAEAALARLVARIAARPRRALLVDDDALARSMLGDALAQSGFEVLSASCGASALGVLARELFAIDVLVADVFMPDVGGHELVETVREAGGQGPVTVVAVTGRPDVELAARLERLGADAVLDKALGPERIARKVSQAVDRRRAAAWPARQPGRQAAPASAWRGADGYPLP